VAVVHFSNLLVRYTGGVGQVTVDAPRVKELLAELGRQFPGLDAELDDLAVAIDGHVHHDALYLPLQPLTEVYFVPKIAGGAGDAGAAAASGD
jgi:molybdopterin converting factor small subunit